MSAILILRPEDAGLIAMIHAESMPDPWNAAAMRDLLKAPSVLGIGVTEDNKIVAFGLFRLVLDEAEILTIATAKNARRAGYASNVLNAFNRHSRERGIARQFLEVAADNTAAIALYIREGYSAGGRRWNYYKNGRDKPVDAILMSRSLTL